MNNVLSIRKINNADIGYHQSNLEPLNGKHRVGKAGIDKNLTLEEVVELAYEIKANIIVKGGPNAKWYLKRFDESEIDEGIEKQKWRDLNKKTMWIIKWEE